jgi:chemotaxis regulatin CheY-phosphate phosphatase CheZ
MPELTLAKEEAEPEAEEVAVEPEVATAEEEPAVAVVDEPVPAVEPEPAVAAVEPEPVVEEAEPEPVLAEAAIAEAEPVVAEAAVVVEEPAPAPVAAVAEAEPVAMSAEDVKREANLAELKDVAHRIINGEQEELDKAVKGEFGELIRLLVDIKTRVDEIPPMVNTSQTSLPNLTTTLNYVDDVTEKAAFNLLANAQQMSEFYNTLQSQIASLDKAVKSENKDLFDKEKATISAQVGEADELGFHILEALEFQDITEQKLRKVLGSIQDVGARLGVIVGYIKSKDESGTKDKAYNHVLTDLGFA